ncbi:Hypothetical protein R9X50_00149300 [Acrodontium crateriforme]|uniref:Xylanolytic transcriptional activator regulatory domain-containing protein n=1 Tax=Acrodontium crateriforme TaxID=150365 RepID=A0AAQ3M0U3_9PEZI|nr:Hypothetical protein R9X50_00149300 [Acrodontium crateriforme]
MQKRCTHFAGAEHDGELDGEPGDNGHPTNGTERTPNGEHSPSISATRTRFVSDLAPESTFLNRTPSSTGPDNSQSNHDIGVWVDRREWDDLVRHRNDTVGGTTRGRRDQRPHSTSLGPLINVYFEKIHPFLPLVDEMEFRRSHAAGLAPEPLSHAICLVAAKDPTAEPHLLLTESKSLLTPREFSTRLHASVIGALKAPCKFDKITLIRILALVAMHTEGPDGTEDASMCLSQAMHHAQTLGIHLGQQSNNVAAHDMSMKRLFWCLWALDRANAAMNGRPLVMADNDIASEPFKSGESGFPAFEAWLHVSEILNKVISFYRPGVSVESTGWEDQFPDFESIIDDVDGWQLSPSLLATIHLFYLSVAILSHRSRGVKQIQRSTNSSVRQRLVAGEIIKWMGSDRAKTVHGMPCIPYAVSLSLSVSYQHLRQSQLTHQQEEARDDIRACTKLLQNLRRTWGSADAMAALAKKVSEELDRSADLIHFRIPRNDKQRKTLGQSGATTEELLPPATVCRGLDYPPENTATTNDSAAGDGISLRTPASGLPSIQLASQENADLFDGMDDIFGTYLDPNYPVHLDEFSFMDDLGDFDDWNKDDRS